MQRRNPLTTSRTNRGAEEKMRKANQNGTQKKDRKTSCNITSLTSSAPRLKYDHAVQVIIRSSRSSGGANENASVLARGHLRLSLPFPSRGCSPLSGCRPNLRLLRLRHVLWTITTSASFRASTLQHSTAENASLCRGARS